jgi:hypothetical protein
MRMTRKDWERWRIKRFEMSRTQGCKSGHDWISYFVPDGEPCPLCREIKIRQGFGRLIEEIIKGLEEEDELKAEYLAKMCFDPLNGKLVPKPIKQISFKQLLEMRRKKAGADGI